MADSFRISSGDGKVSDLSIKKSYDKAIEAVRSMDPATAYVAVKAILLPVLSKISNPETISMSAPSPMQLAGPNSSEVSHSSVIELGKTLRELQSSKKSSKLIQNIHSMEPHTAYALLGGHLATLLKAPLQMETKNRLLQAPVFLSPSSVNSVSFLDFIKGIDKIKGHFKDIEERMNDLKKNYKTIMSLLIDKDDKNSSQITNAKDGLWPINPSVKNWRRNGGLFGEFFVTREFIKDKLKKINDTIKEMEKYSPDSSLLKQVKESAENLLKNIPEPSDKWSKEEGEYNGRVWVHGSSWHVKWKGDKGEGKGAVENPLGLLEMTQDPKRFSDYISNITSSLKEIDKFSSTKEFHLLKLRALDTGKAYVYLITVVLPFLQNEAAESLEEQGQTMKEVSQLHDKWNEIQDEINEMAKQAQIAKEKKIFDEGNLQIDRVNGYFRESDKTPWKITMIFDPDKKFKKLFECKQAINQKIEEFKAKLDEIAKKLPSSSKELIVVLRERAEQLILPGEYRGYYHEKSPDHFHLEVPIGTEQFPLDVSNEEIKKYIIKTTERDFGFFTDSDQSKFKNYVDNIAQGITALTSVSNMTQQEVQIASQYYNSLIGLQKNGFDSIMKVIQITTKPPQH